MNRLLMGNEAIALGAMRAGVNIITGYPGTPSTEILETAAKHNDGSIYIEWSVNEKAALETAAGAAFCGARAMVTMKQVGLNIASDPLMSLNYLGVKGGMVIVTADDPGPISSQTEQDTRHFAKFAKLAIFDPSTPEEAYTMIADAFAHSEKYGEPVLFRPTTRVCHSCSSIEILPDLPKIKPAGFEKDKMPEGQQRWVIFPKLTYANKFKIEENLKKMSDEFSVYKNNTITDFTPNDTDIITKGIVSGGVSYAYALEALHSFDKQNTKCKLLKISTYPFPEKLVLQFLNGLNEVLVIEELDPVIENELLLLCGIHHLNIKILGKRSGSITIAGENSPDSAAKAIAAFLNISQNPVPAPPDSSLPSLPVRPPVLCAGCPHRASFFAVKEAVRALQGNTQRAVFSGDIGCYTLGNAAPLNMTDTCICMGASITAAQGLARAEPGVTHFAFIGDSTFFHSGITGVINAIYNQTDIIVVILDNGTTAMTGNQPHPGMGITMMNTRPKKISIEKILKAAGVSSLIKVNPFNQKAAKNAVRKLMAQNGTHNTGVRVLLFEAPCINIKAAKIKRKETVFINSSKCTGCKLCVNRLGCPAISYNIGKAVIDKTLCTGCGICMNICPPGAIKRAKAGKK